MYPQSMLLSINKKNNVYSCKPQFYYIKVGFKGIKIIYACFRDGRLSSVIRRFCGHAFQILVQKVCLPQKQIHYIYTKDKMF